MNVLNFRKSGEIMTGRYTKLKQRYWYRDNETGKRKYKRTASTPGGVSKQIWAENYSDWGKKKDDWVEQLARELETGLSGDELAALENITVADLSKEWLEEISPKRVAEGTVERRTTSFNSYVANSSLANAKLVDLTTKHMKLYFKTLDNVSAMRRAKDYLNPLFKYAKDELEIISTNPIPSNVLSGITSEEKIIVANKMAAKDEIIFDDEEMAFLYNQSLSYSNKTGKNVHIPIALMMYGGMRVSEALATQIHNVDLKLGTLSVNNQTKRVNKKKHGTSKMLVPPKTKNSTRSYPLPLEVSTIVLDGRYSRKDDFLFTQKDGNYAVKNHWTTNIMIPFLKEIGLYDKFQEQPNHLLRKYYGSKKILDNIPLHVVAKWMGTSVEVLQETYAKEIATVEKSYYNPIANVTSGVTSPIMGGIKV